METIFERVGALDVHKAQVTACVRVPDGVGRREPQVAEFTTTVQGLIALRDWLAAHRVTHVAMEATGVYWQPVWHILRSKATVTASKTATSPAPPKTDPARTTLLQHRDRLRRPGGHLSDQEEGGAFSTGAKGCIFNRP